MERRRLIAGAAGALLFSLAPCQIAWGAKLVNVRMWPAAEYTRVTIETDEPLKYKHFFVRSAKPLRLVIDIEGLALTERIKKLIAAVNPDDPYIQSMRIGQYKPGVVRLAMDLKTDVKPEVFLLKPFADYQYRLVFDIYPAHPKDEVGKILAGEADPNEDPLLSAMGGLSSDANEPDPLADILAGLNAPREDAFTKRACPLSSCETIRLKIDIVFCKEDWGRQKLQHHYHRCRPRSRRGGSRCNRSTPHS